MKKINHTTLFLLLSLFGIVFFNFSCKKGLDYVNNNAINPENVWTDPNMIKAYLNDIYGALMPSWPFNGSSSDEGLTGGAKSLSEYQRGIVTVANSHVSLNYNYIDRINFFLDHLAAVPETILPAALKEQYIGEAKFWRAWAYWSMVSQVGGVPLILETQNVADTSKLFLPRSTTSASVSQIVSDLDEAIAGLPGIYVDGADYGRITKVAAMSFKGRVLLWYASPLFNPANDVARWQAAYDANKAAMEYAKSQGHGLYENYRDIWYQERNKEVIMVNQFFYPGHSNNFNLIRPEQLTRDASNTNMPILTMLLAYPKRDGSSMQFDKEQLADPVYNAQFLTDFYTKRDDRFYATIFFGGIPYPTPDEVSPHYLKSDNFWNAWRYKGSGARDDRTSYDNLLVSDFGMPGNSGIVGFFQRKGLDTTVTATFTDRSQTDWPEIRYAEVLMNYGECANELGKSAEALDVLKQIRKRAGIIPGVSGNYGIIASTREEIRETYIRERRVEFAFENKRFHDLRRWKRFDILNDQGARHGLYTVINPGLTVNPSETIMDATTRAKFTAVYIPNLDGDPAYKFNYDVDHWFYALDPAQISQSKNILEQNNEWGGSFDPLQ